MAQVLFMRRDEALLLDIAIAAEDAQMFVRDLDWNTFQQSRLHQNAVIRSLEIIGEAAGKLSATIRDAHPDIPWRDMINMRHRLIHAYDAVRLEVVWDLATKSLSVLRSKLSPLIPPDV